MTHMHTAALHLHREYLPRVHFAHQSHSSAQSWSKSSHVALFAMTGWVPAVRLLLLGRTRAADVPWHMAINPSAYAAN
jgi:hypothetical protein